MTRTAGRGPHDGALRPRRARPAAGRAERVGHWRMRWRRGAGRRLARHRVDGARRICAAGRRRRSSARSTEAAFGAQPLLPRAARARARLLGVDSSTACSAAWHGAPRRVGGRHRRRRPGRHLRLAAGRACPIACSATRETARSRTSRRPPASASSTAPRSRSSPTSTTTATRTSCS